MRQIAESVHLASAIPTIFEITDQKQGMTTPVHRAKLEWKL
jgi:hypothetical protein